MDFGRQEKSGNSLPVAAFDTKIKNIVISGTSFWNPGDDFVRDGVIRVLKKLFKGYTLNFLFYNFNQDFFPQSEFSGIHNMAAAGDIDKYAPFIDAVVVAGLSAGNEIKDLYDWVIKNKLHDRVYLIGAGYENDYVARYIAQNPEATIFENARIIIGRTEKTPAFISKLGLPYHHINCPAILSVEEVKCVPAEKKIERIGFSIQIPHNIGIANQSTGESMYQLAVEILLNLSSKYAVEVVAHHKTEYFHFLNLLKGRGIPVVFSSFYQDLFDIYQRYDLVISTRLHACLFANGFGIPAFIINDTDRHTHTAGGFPYSICVNNMSRFSQEFERIRSTDLGEIARETRIFKEDLMQKYLNVLAGPFGVDTRFPIEQRASAEQADSRPNQSSDTHNSCSSTLVPADYQFDSETNEQKLVHKAVKQGMTVFDVGAHLGKYTKLFSLLVGDKGRVYAFEPTPGSSKKLACSLQELNCSNVTLIGKAVYSENRKVVINEFPEKYSSWNSLGRPKMLNPEDQKHLVPIVSSVEVEAVTLDSFCHQHNIRRIDYLKLDVEGAEIDALRGASNLLESKAVRYLQFEISEKMLQGLNTDAGAVFDFLKSKGYECHRIDRDGNVGDIATDSNSFYENYIAYPAVDIGPQLLASVCNDSNAKRRVLSIVSRLTKDRWLEQNIEVFSKTVDSEASWFDAVSFLNWYSESFKPENYLEIGVRRGRSLAQVMVQSPQTKAYGFDLWIPEYSGTANPGPDFVISELKNLGVNNLPKLIAGDSHNMLPKFWSDFNNPQQFELIFVDGDHTYEGARKDLDICFAHLAAGGALVFDDIRHPSHPELRNLWEECKVKYSDCIFIEHSHGCGAGVAFKSPFTKLERYLHLINQQAAGQAGKVTSLDDDKVETVDRPESSLPVHFFTIVLNGQPFIRHHIEVFKQMPFKWHWHIMEGVADLKHDTAWSLKMGGRISNELHHNGRSNDGTTEYLDELAQRYPENITIYRKSEGVFWDGKLEMVNAPLANIKQECLLWQVDADELWTLEQICAARDMFIAEPDRTAAYYLNHFFVGENLVTTTIDTYGNNTGYEWLRTWRFKPGYRWTAHEPPRLCMPAENGTWADIAAIKPFKHNCTSAKGLVFQHYAYATEKQLGFKEIYYGYKNAIAQWRRLQQQNDFPVFLRDYFAWVNDAAQVNTVKSQNITPIARFMPAPQIARQDAKSILWSRTDSIGDAVLASSMLPHLRKGFPAAKITVLCQKHIAELFESCPFIDSLITIPTEHKWENAAQYEDVIRAIRKLQPDLLINSVYSEHVLSDLPGLEFIPRRVAFRNTAKATYTDIVPSDGKWKSELLRHGDMLRGLGLGEQELQPVVWTTKSDDEWTEEIFRTNGLKKETTIALFCGVRYNVRTYSDYGKALAGICRSRGFTIIALGSAGDYDANQRNLDDAGVCCLNLSGKVTLRQSAAIIRNCRLAIGAETGLAHIACAVGTPNVILLGGGHFGRFMPYSPLTSVVALPLECFGCNWNCRYEKVYCVAEIQPEVMDEAIRQSLLNRSEKPRVFVQSNPAYKPGTGKPQLKSLEKVLNTDSFEVIEVGNLNKGERLLAQSSSMSLSKTDCRVFSYSKKSHFELFKGYDTELYAGAVDPDNCDLKNYQDLLVLLFIRENIPTGSRILDIGGGDSRILKHLKDEYECWNLDKLEGRGSGPASIDSTGYRLVKDYIGNFNKELPDNYFDFVFSVSALEHVPDDNQDYLGNIRDDMERILKPGGYSLHCFDVVIKKDSVWTNKLLPFFCQNLKMITPFVPFEELERDPDLYVMTEKSYQKRWQHLTGKSYGEFGKPLSYNVLWQKMPSPSIKTSGIIGRFDKANVPKISVVTPSFNQAEYLEECIDSILCQNYPNLEYVIMDGASTDGSVEIIKKYEKYLSYWQSRPDGGQYAAINEGFKRATGEIMTWLNSDDKYHTDSLFKAAHVFGKYPDIEWITGRPTAWNEKGELIRVFDKLPLWSREKYLNRAFKDCCIQQESTFWTRTLWDKAGGKLESHLQFAGDLELWVRFFRHAGLFTVDALLGGYRYQRKQKTNLCMDKYIQEGNQIIDQELADIRKGKFTMMLPAPKPVSFDEKEFQEHKKKIVSADIPDSRSEYGLQPQKDAALTVATSIAPCQLAKQVNAIESWIKLGFDVVSINGEEEIETLKGTFPNVRFIQAKRDARNILGRPFVYFDDILEYLRQTDSEICGIVNSDIYLSGDENVVSFIRSQAKNSLVYGARTEVDSLENLSGTAYQYGFDFFFFDKSLISHFPKSDFCIGATWWDYWMPVILVLAGCPVKKLISPFAYHVRHPCKWDLKQWFLMGGKLYGYLRERICEKIASKSLTGNWDLLARMLSAYVRFFIKKTGSVQNKDEHTKILYQSGGPCILEFLGIESQPIDQTGRHRAKSPNADDYTDSNITVGISFEDYQKAGELNQCGEYLLNKGDTEGAMKAFTEATRILPDFTAAYVNIGVSYLRKDQPAAALKYFTKALKIDPVYLPAVINSAGVLIRCGKIQTARNLVLNSAQKLIDSGMPGKAAEIYRAYLWENPSDGEIIKALENLGIIESAEAGAQTKNIPIVFIHWGDSDCLKYTLAQARLSNPQSKIYLIGDQANDKYDFVEHHDYSKYCQSAQRFERVYKHLSPNSLCFERMCFLRWFILQDFLKAMNIRGCVSPDSDVMIYTDVSSQWQRFARFGMTVSGFDSIFANPHCNFISDVDLLNEFCDFIVQGYTDPTSLRQMEVFFEPRRGKGLPGVSDMAFLRKFWQKYPDRMADITVIAEGSKFDNNIKSSEGFEMERGRKKIYWVSGRPQGKLIDTGSLVTFNNLHFQDKAKDVIKDYCTGKLQLSSDGKKWSVKEDGNTAHFEPAGRDTTAESSVDASLSNRSGNKYLVTAIVSAYNSERFIRGCLDDLERQTIADKLEIIVVDSGSQENEAAVVKEFQQRYNNIKYIRTERETIYGAWNRGIKAASGKYLTNANTDDQHYKDSLEKLTEALEQNPWAVIAYGNQHITSTIDGVITGELGSELNHLKLLNGTCLESQPMWRRDLHDVVGYFDEQFFCSGDYEFWIRATQQFEMLHVDIFTGKRLVNDSVVSLANQFLLSVENCIIAQSYAYAMQTGEQIGKHGISGDARLANLLEINVWKRRVAAKLACRQGQTSDEIVGVNDIRTGSKPKLSVVAIETDATRWQCLQSLVSQSDQDFELILIAYRSIPSQSDLSPFTGRICIVQLKDDIGAAFARNVGIAYAKGDFIVYLDSSMQANPGWVEAIFRQFTNPKVMAARGQIINNNYPPQAVVTESYATFCENADNCAFRKSVLLEAKGFDEDMIALEGQELSYRICEFSHNALDMFRFEPGMLVRLDVSISEPQQIIQKIRNSHMQQLLWRKHNDAVGYIEFYLSQDPSTSWQYDNDYVKVIAIAIFLQKGHPELAMKWVEKAVAIDPSRIKGRYLLGISYFEMGSYDKAAAMLEPAFLTQLQNLGNPDVSASEFERQTINVDCCLSAGTKLAQCYMKEGQYGKLKKVYTLLLSSPHLAMPPEQRASIQALLGKLQNVKDVPVQAAVPQADSPAHYPLKPEPCVNAADKKDEKYLVSAIVSTYNSETFIRGCLEDLENQTIADKLEIIVVNSGSEQNEESSVKEFQKKYGNIVYIKTEREGLYSAWNRAVKAAHGQFLTNANTDDRHSKDAYEIMVKTLIDNPDVALVYGDQIRTDTPNDTFENNCGVEKLQRPEYSHERLLFGCCVGSQPMWRKSLHDGLGLFDESLTGAGDWDFWLRISKKYKFKRIPQFLGLYYYNEDGVEHGTKIHSLYERYIVGKRYGNPYISVIPIYKNNRNPLVSIIMPAYNAGRFIAGAIESALIQNYHNFEIVVVDDGSTDNTKEILQKFNDPRIRYIALERNQGVSHARNVAIQQAKGEFIVSLDADDMLMPDFISRHLIEFEKHPDADMIYCDDLLIDENDKPIREIKRQNYRNCKSLIGDLFRYGFPIVHCRHFVRKNVFDRIGLYDESLIIGEDYDLMRKFVKEDLKFYHLPESLCLRRVVDSSLSRKFSAEKAKSHFDVVKRYSDTFACEELFPDVDWNKVAPEKRKLQAKCLSAVTCVTIGQTYAKTAPVYAKTAFDQACSELDECFRMDPANPHVQQLLRKCEAVRIQCEQAVQEVVY